MNQPTNNAVNLFRGSPGVPIPTTNEAEAWATMIDRARNQKMEIVSLETNDDFMNRVRHCLKDRELLAEFVARTGLGPNQASTMTPEEITSFVSQAERNAEDELKLSAWQSGVPIPKFVRV